MRPEPLFPLFGPLTTLAGIGPRLAPLVEKLVGGPHVVDLLWHLPSGLIDRRFSPPLDSAPDGAVVTLEVEIEHHRPATDRRRPYQVVCRSGDHRLVLVYFHARSAYLRDLLPEGETRIVSGKLERYHGQAQITHPDRVATLAERAAVQTVEPIYPLSAGVVQKTLLKAMDAALRRVPTLPEWLDSALCAREGWPDFATALHQVHHPRDGRDLDPSSPARRRLAYDEILANLLALALVRAKMRRLGGRSLRGDGRLRQAIQDALPYRLTGAQDRALDDIFTDMAAPGRMLRLLQGDVGSGKTVVALLAMLAAVEAGSQAVLMAPTEILARQHIETLTPLLDTVGITPVLLTGREKGKARDKILAALAAGDSQIAIGTHALFQETVHYRDLGLAVIDEQHRFGVHQRLTLAAKGRAVDVLVMTATPIPRTLTLTAFGDMEVSRLDEKPPGRRPVTTRAMPVDRLEEVVAGITRAIAGGARVYWVCPLVGESEQLDLQAAEDRHRHLAAAFGEERVGLVHGKMKGKQKDAVMAAFAAGEIDILVATTVIEVGVNVPEASVMVIEHAERFGLAQLHQLRGRIGRGTAASSCVLLYTPPLGAVAKARLQILRNTEDGFRIAEEDLRLRGAGDLLGTRQSGLVDYRLADLALHEDLIGLAGDDTRLILARDPELDQSRGAALRLLLYLFERDEAVRYFRSG